ncbi:MAG: response regulator [Thermodesulfobacteriota bacterium]
MNQKSQTARLVLVEDNPADVYLIKKALQENHIRCEVTHFEDGEDALAALLSEGEGALLADAILIDLNTPRSEGLEVLKTLRQAPRLADVPIGILTSSEAPADRQRAALLGAARYIHKPTELADFLRQVGLGVKELLHERAERRKARGGR